MQRHDPAAVRQILDHLFGRPSGIEIVSAGFRQEPQSLREVGPLVAVALLPGVVRRGVDENLPEVKYYEIRTRLNKSPVNLAQEEKLH